MWGLHEVLSRLDYMEAQLNQIINQLSRLTGVEIAMSASLDRLTSDVAAQTSVIGSAQTLLQGLSEKIRAIAAQSDDSAALDELATQVEANSAALAQAVTANTPAAPAAAAPSAPSAPASTDASAPAPADGSAPAAPAPDMGNAS